ncbi:MAG: 30S ribosome-binding factor RbfA [Proteobacteria bacterium]|nr:30S ribosome-binding factor RbfA [Pseudomonadota bacterium]
MSSFRNKRVAELVYGVIASELRSMNEEYFELVTVSSVEMSPDLKTAWVYWSLMELASDKAATPEAEKIKLIEVALEEKSYFFKKRIASDLKLRYTPKLVFKYDDSYEYASKIEALMKKVSPQ